jgi:competence protein ComEC
VAATAVALGVIASASIPAWPVAPVSAVAALALSVPAFVNLVHARRPGRGRPPDGGGGGGADLRAARRAPGRAPVAADCLLIVGLVAAGAANYDARHRLVRPDDVSRLPGDRTIEVEAVVVESRTRSSGSPRVVARGVRAAPGAGGAGGAPCSGLAWVAWPEGVDPPARGDRVSLSGRLRAPGGPRNPASFNFRAYLRNRGIHAVLTADRAEVRPARHVPERAAAWVRSRVGARLGCGAGALLLGLLLGETGGIEPELVEALRRSGTVHVTAVSGLHVGFIVLIAYTLFRTARTPPRAARLLVLPLLAGFVLIVGPRASVIRAGVMAASLIVSSSLERRADPLNALGLAALALIVARPGVVLDLGFRLSFGAATGILLLFEPIRAALRRATARLGRTGRWLADAFAVSTSAQAGVAPILIAVFGEISIVAPLANLVIVPVAAFAVSSGIAMLAADALPPPLARVFAASAWASLELIECVALRLGARPWAAQAVAAAYWPSFLAAAAGLRFALTPTGRVRRRAGGVALAVVTALAATATLLGPGRSYPRAVFFDVGQGDAALLEIPWRRYVLVDAGPGGAGGRRRDAGRDVVLPYLRRQAVRDLDVLVVTHGHDDHVGGAPAVLNGVPARELVLPAGGGREPCLARLAAIALGAGARVREPACGDTLLTSRRSTIVVLGPPDDWSERPPSENDRSVVLRASLGEARVLLTGDIEGAGERRLVSGSGGLASHVLKVPHHGSCSSSTPGFVGAVSPGLAICSVGARNRHGHPDPAVVRRLEAAGAEIFRTDEDGAVLVSVRGGVLRARSLASGRATRIPLYGSVPGALGPTRMVADRSRSITRRAAARTSSADTASTSAANRSP